MKMKQILLPAMLVVRGAKAGAQVYSQNIVGDINQELYPGDNLIANQLSISNNTLNAILNGTTSDTTLPEGATFTEWNPTTQQYLPASVYDVSTGWSIDYVLTYGQGGLLNTPTAFTNTFLGSVWPGFSGNSTNFIPPLVSGIGTLLLADYIPIAPATFYDVVGRDPVNGESVTTLDPASQTYTTSSFENGAWNNGTPGLQVGQSALFDLENPATVPEPAIGALSGAGTLALMLLRRSRRRV